VPLIRRHLSIEDASENEYLVIQRLQLVPELRVLALHLGHVHGMPNVLGQAPVIIVSPRMPLLLDSPAFTLFFFRGQLQEALLDHARHPDSKAAAHILDRLVRLSFAAAEAEGALPGFWRYGRSRMLCREGRLRGGRGEEGERWLRWRLGLVPYSRLTWYRRGLRTRRRGTVAR